MTGEPLREVNFYLPGYNIPMLRSVAGYEDFNPSTEVLHCDKLGTGSVDAPRAFSLKLKKVILQEGRMQQCSIDNELCVKHVQG